MIITPEYRRAHDEQYQAMRAYRRECLMLDRVERERWPDEQIDEQRAKAGAAHLRRTQAHEDYLEAAEQQRELNATTESASANRLTPGRTV
jgi:hypothetical protein